MQSREKDEQTDYLSRTLPYLEETRYVRTENPSQFSRGQEPASLAPHCPSSPHRERAPKSLTYSTQKTILTIIQEQTPPSTLEY